MKPYSHLFVLLILWSMLAAALFFCWMLLDTPAKAQAELLPDCRVLLHETYQARVDAGDKESGITQVGDGAAKMAFYNPDTGVITEYFLVANERIIAGLNNLNVYGECIIPASVNHGVTAVATMYYTNWFGSHRLERL